MTHQGQHRPGGLLSLDLPSQTTHQGQHRPGGLRSLDLPSLRYANVASNALLTLNSAINFAVYCLVGKKFRRIFVREVGSTLYSVSLSV